MTYQQSDYESQCVSCGDTVASENALCKPCTYRLPVYMRRAIYTSLRTKPFDAKEHHYWITEAIKLLSVTGKIVGKRGWEK